MILYAAESGELAYDSDNNATTSFLKYMKAHN